MEKGTSNSEYEHNSGPQIALEGGFNSKSSSTLWLNDIPERLQQHLTKWIKIEKEL